MTNAGTCHPASRGGADDELSRRRRHPSSSGGSMITPTGSDLPLRFQVEQRDTNVVLVRVPTGLVRLPNGASAAGLIRFALQPRVAERLVATGGAEIVPSVRCRVVKSGKTRSRGPLPAELLGHVVLIEVDEVDALIEAGIVERVAERKRQADYSENPAARPSQTATYGGEQEE
jgi:hypothetical protein